MIITALPYVVFMHLMRNMNLQLFSRLWTLFSRSTLRWETLKKKLKCYVKQKSEKRWSAQVDMLLK